MDMAVLAAVEMADTNDAICATAPILFFSFFFI